MRPPFLSRRAILTSLGGVLVGAVYGFSKYGDALAGALVGGSIAVALSMVERFLLRRNSGAVVPKLPFLKYLGLRTSLYLIVIVVINTTIVRLLYAPPILVVLQRSDLPFTLGICVAVTLILGVNDLLGPGVLLAFAAGRYHQPRREERILLFIDLRSSTSTAERLGELRFLSFLNQFFADVASAVAAAGGEIHKYVGDEVIATWPMAAGYNAPDCIRGCFAALAELVARAPKYEEEFGLSADFRAALHGGPLVVGELGFLKMEIALIGDTMNTAARILEACRTTGERVLASAALLERLGPLPAGVTRRALDPFPVRGKKEALLLYALDSPALADRRGARPARVEARLS